MEVLQVRPRGLYINIEFAYDELKKLRDVCSHVEVKIDKAKPEEVAMADFFSDKFYPLVNKLVEDLKNDA